MIHILIISFAQQLEKHASSAIQLKLFYFLAVQDSSIGDLVTQSLSQWVSDILISMTTMTKMTTMTTMATITTMTTITTLTKKTTKTTMTTETETAIKIYIYIESNSVT